MVTILLLCLAGTAYANPILVPDVPGIVIFGVFLGAAVAAEAGLVTLVLLFWGADPMPVFKALIVGNLLIYFLIFQPLLEASSAVWIAEAVIIGLDGLLIKGITALETFQDDSFRPVRWGYAFVIAALGNVLSYYIGVATSG